MIFFKHLSPGTDELAKADAREAFIGPKPIYMDDTQPGKANCAYVSSFFDLEHSKA